MKADSVMQVELYFSANGLKSKDTFSKSDPFLTMAMQQSHYGNIEPLGRTETIKDTENP